MAFFFRHSFSRCWRTLRIKHDTSKWRQDCITCNRPYRHVVIQYWRVWILIVNFNFIDYRIYCDIVIQIRCIHDRYQLNPCVPNSRWFGLKIIDFRNKLSVQRNLIFNILMKMSKFILMDYKKYTYYHVYLLSFYN